jgi:hypothetical protein
MSLLTFLLLFAMANSVQITSGGAIKITPDQKVQLALELPDPTLFCDSVSTSKSKCGFITAVCVGGDDDGETKEIGECSTDYDLDTIKYWFTKNHINIPNSDCPPSENCMDYTTGFCLDTDWGCVYNFFAGSRSQDYTLSETYTGDDCSDLDTETESLTISTYCGCQDSNPIGGDPLCPDPSTIDVRCPADCQSAAPPYAQDCTTIATTYTYASEFTTDVLISNAEDDLPDYSNCWACADDGCATCGDDCSFEDGQDCDCSASYDLSDDETSLAIQNFQYLFTMDDPPPAGAVLHWVERFTPDDPDTGDPDPGAAVDNEKSFTWNGSQTQTDIFECPHPDSNGEITIEDARW